MGIVEKKNEQGSELVISSSPSLDGGDNRQAGQAMP